LAASGRRPDISHLAAIERFLHMRKFVAIDAHGNGSDAAEVGFGNAIGGRLIRGAG
jgi:hypothetical protein